MGCGLKGVVVRERLEVDEAFGVIFVVEEAWRRVAGGCLE